MVELPSPIKSKPFTGFYDHGPVDRDFSASEPSIGRQQVDSIVHVYALVRARIEVAVLNFLRILTSPDPAISDLPLIKRNSSNSRVSRGLLTDLSWVFLSHSFCTRSLMRANAAKAFVRVWKVMEVCFLILVQEKRVTQRELFYKLLCVSPEYFSSQLQVNRTIQDVVALLRCSRYSLGIMASSRGVVAGRLLLQEPNQEVVDCAECGSSGYAISGDLNMLDKLLMTTDARYIIVVEKHAIFQRLAEDRVFNHIPSILITAKGYPDIATRFLLHRMSRTFPELPILALVDWNPAGLAILCTFKFGSIGMGLEAYRYGAFLPVSFQILSLSVCPGFYSMVSSFVQPAM
ncbi:hypothetical protein GH714_010294 [Hevea brasiliensis]|uniref:DNA topoisomerase (ATP-hydrolyzing) n=1 Tax=Hevea brasiliensis TaxID=3981 RepID=A0A6A6MZ35_HEVBR|nr:hypothetical protein GH714_010294 [Hevea brasiliensis]